MLCFKIKLMYLIALLYFLLLKLAMWQGVLKCFRRVSAILVFHC